MNEREWKKGKTKEKTTSVNQDGVLTRPNAVRLLCCRLTRRSQRSQGLFALTSLMAPLWLRPVADADESGSKQVEMMMKKK